MTKKQLIDESLTGSVIGAFFEVYKTYYLGTQRVDMVVDDRLIVESKSTQELHRGAPRHLFSYLHGSTFEIGLLLHFGPEARFFAVACHNRDAGIASNPNGQAPSPGANRPFPQGSDPSILESLNPSRLIALVVSWWGQRKLRRLEAQYFSHVHRFVPPHQTWHP